MIEQDTYLFFEDLTHSDDPKTKENSDDKDVEKIIEKTKDAVERKDI